MDSGSAGFTAERVSALSVSPSAPLSEAIAIVNGAGLQVALVVGADGKLEGLLSDGDIRRAMLGGKSLTDPTSSAMQTNPITLVGNPVAGLAMKLMRSKGVNHIPFIDSDGKPTGIITSLDFIRHRHSADAIVVIMAGGRGLRLGKMTDSRPKPMLEVGKKPVLEIIVEHCVEFGLREIYISVGYLSEQIMQYFGDGSEWGCAIHYLEEAAPLGTAGSLSLLPKGMDGPILVLNGDVLTTTNLGSFLEFHNEVGAAMTLGVREYSMQVPFGVVEVENSRVIGVREKPAISRLVNAGCYVLNSEILQYIEADTFLDMPDLIGRLLESDYLISAFPLHEGWIDIGSPETLSLARKEWN